ncbi:MAG: hypothetical protein LBS19_05750 [Clostridiales bacterium]|jgi:hypothetical protein|nr:hypothetical protein [Clostridiales bacterium]
MESAADYGLEDWAVEVDTEYGVDFAVFDIGPDAAPLLSTADYAASPWPMITRMKDITC